MPQQFPEDPRVGQVFDIDPNGESAWMKQIRVYTDNATCIAEAQGFSRIATSAKKYLLKGIISCYPLPKGTHISVQITERQILSYIFLEDSGWTPKRLGDPLTVFGRKGHILQEPVLTLTSGSFNVFNEIVVDLPPPEEVKETSDEQNAQPAEHAGTPPGV